MAQTDLGTASGSAVTIVIESSRRKSFGYLDRPFSSHAREIAGIFPARAKRDLQAPPGREP